MRTKAPFLLVTLAATWSAAAQISFQFNFTDAAGTGFNDVSLGAQRRGALSDSIGLLGQYFVTSTPITLTYDVVSVTNPSSGTLASAGSDLISTTPGFHPTVVQNKIITGVDANGAAADGNIEFNFANAWGYGTTIGSAEYDFVSTAIHEALHSFGFLSVLGSTGDGILEHTPGTPDGWSTYDSFLTNSDGAFLIDHSSYGFNTEATPALTSGVYFSGTHGASAYGDQVPLYSPEEWEQGSSISHLDDDTFTSPNPSDLNSLKMMNAATETGLGVRTLSPIELGILQDLGYTVSAVPEPGTLGLVAVVATFSLGLWRRRVAASAA